MAFDAPPPLNNPVPPEESLVEEAESRVYQVGQTYEFSPRANTTLTRYVLGLKKVQMGDKTNVVVKVFDAEAGIKRVTQGKPDMVGWKLVSGPGFVEPKKPRARRKKTTE